MVFLFWNKCSYNFVSSRPIIYSKVTYEQQTYGGHYHGRNKQQWGGDSKMGRGITGINDKDNGFVIEPAETGTNTGTGTSGNSTSTTSTGTNTGTGTGTRTGTNTGTNTTDKPTQEVSELALLTEEEKAKYLIADETEKKRLIRNAKKRQRYAEKKQANGQDVKPRKVKGAKKEETTPALDVTQLNMIVASLSAVVASRPNCEHWLLNEKEINSITVPLSKMLAESTMFANMGQYSNQITLCMACVTVFMPRLIITVQKQKEVKKIARTGQSTNTNVNDERVRPTGEKKDSNSRTDRGNVKQSSSNGKDNADNVPFYGVPIC